MPFKGPKGPEKAKKWPFLKGKVKWAPMEEISTSRGVFWGKI